MQDKRRIKTVCTQLILVGQPQTEGMNAWGSHDMLRHLALHTATPSTAIAGCEVLPKNYRFVAWKYSVNSAHIQWSGHHCPPGNEGYRN